MWLNGAVNMQNDDNNIQMYENAMAKEVVCMPIIASS